MPRLPPFVALRRAPTLTAPVARYPSRDDPLRALAAAPLGSWDRSRLVPTRRQLAVTATLAVAGAIGLTPFTLNAFVEVLGEAIFVSMVLLFGFKVAGAWRQTILPRWVAQLLAVALGRRCRR
jgi:hypothetical protein